MNGPQEPEDLRALRKRLQKLQSEHRALDERICACESGPYADQIGLRRMKKRKLFLRDEIEKVRSDLIPDLNA